MAQPLDASVDKGGLAPHRNFCPHVGSAINVPSNISFDDTTCSKSDCEETECWLCLHCHQVLCGRYGNEHMMMHYAENPSHCMAMGLGDLSFWCYKCSDYVNHLSLKRVWDCYSVAHLARFGEPVPPKLLSKTTFTKSSANADPKVVMESIPESKEDVVDDNVSEETKMKMDVIFGGIKQFDASNLNEAETVEKHIVAVTDYAINGAAVSPPDAMETESKSNGTSIEVLDGLLSDLRVSGSSTPKLSASHCRTALFYHADCLLHRPGKGRSHVERPERCSRPFAMLKEYGLLPYLKQIAPREATKEELEGSHGASHVARTSALEDHGWFDSDTFYNEHSSRAAKLAAGATVDVMAGILEGDFENGFALVRPPGHHCEHNKGHSTKQSLYTLSLIQYIHSVSESLSLSDGHSFLWIDGVFFL